MPLIGLTGGIASGKSTVARLFAQLGARVLSADDMSREVTSAGSPVVWQIARELGSQYVDANGILDRHLLAERVFSDAAARATLEHITHPAILAQLRARIGAIEQDEPGAIVVVEAPLLFEAGMDDWFDAIVVVACDPGTQIARMCTRDGLSRSEAQQRVDAQMPLAERVARATHIIRNDGSPAELEGVVRHLWRELTGDMPAPGKTP